jgi:hypothetical protein
MRYRFSWADAASFKRRSIPRNGSRQPRGIASQWCFKKNLRRRKAAAAHSHKAKTTMRTAKAVERVESAMSAEETT